MAYVILYRWYPTCLGLTYSSQLCVAKVDYILYMKKNVDRKGKEKC